jgi:Histidine kinase-, DNA gyrase B-, and HSP90-like ATPase
MPKIVVHEKALGHLSRGLYRSPASALRELVSNAWDANATSVNITTGYPQFTQLSVQDDGDGFTRQEFERLMGGGIGNSNKRLENSGSRYGRPVIGRLGIGMLGIAQICPNFVVASRTKDGQGFRATVRLYDLLRQKLDKKKPKTKLMTVDVGVYEVDENFDPTTIDPGTLVYSDVMHPTVTRTMLEAINHQAFVEPALEWAECIKQVSKQRTLNELGEYWKLLWELAAACPLPYVDEEAVPNHLIKKDHAALKKYLFRVVVDGIELRKPVYLKDNKEGYTTVEIQQRAEEVYGSQLRYHGYIAVQEGKQLQPDELRGILIRLKQVGIGYYDGQLLDYRINHGPRSRWVTGEIFVDEGLDDALNIDRDSFNRFNPHYKALQHHVHEILSNKIFPEVYKQIERRSKKKAAARSVARKDATVDVVSETIPRDTKPSNQPFKLSAIPEELRVKKSQSQLAEAILTIFDAAAKEKDHATQRSLFAKLLVGLLSRW